MNPPKPSHRPQRNWIVIRRHPDRRGYRRVCGWFSSPQLAHHFTPVGQLYAVCEVPPGMSRGTVRIYQTVPLQVVGIAGQPTERLGLWPERNGNV